MLGLTELQADQKKLIGGFHPLGSNFIIINKAPLRKIMEKNKKLYQPYVFHMLLREYMHSFGIMDETLLKQNVKKIVYRIRNIHSYSMPCVVSLPIKDGNTDYIRWIKREVR